MVVLVAAEERWLARHDILYSTLDVASYRFPGRFCGEASRCQVLCFGDSLVKHDVVPAVVEGRTGKSVYNLAVPGGMPLATHVLLRRVFEQGGRPEAVLVDFKSRILSVDPRGLARGISGLTTFRESVELGGWYHDPNFLATLVLSRLCTSYRDRYQIRSVVARHLDPERPLNFTPWPAFWRNWSQNRGGQLNFKNPQAAVPEGPKDVVDYLLPYWRCDPRNERSVVRFLELASAHRIPVYWLIPPVHPKVQLWRDERGADAPYDRFVRAMQGRFPNVRVIDARHSGYGADLFFDAVHLDRDGAVAFSAQVAEVLRDGGAGRFAGARWVNLPRDRPSPGDDGRRFEDMNQSWVALSAPDGRRSR